MGKIVIKHKMGLEARYLVWNTVVDAPITVGMTKAELADWWREEYGRSGEQTFNFALDRAKTLDDVVACNRAGKDETHLTIEQMVEFYFVKCDTEADPPLGTDPFLDDD